MTTALQTHQSLRQLTGNDEVYGAVTGSCGTKVCFQVGGDDARKMADEFGGFVAADLMNLPKLHALARVGPRDASFNLETFFLPDPERPADEAAADLRERTRRRYATPKADIRKELEALREFLPKRTPVDPFSAAAAKAKQERKAREAAANTEGEAQPVVTGAKVLESVPPPPSPDVGEDSVPTPEPAPPATKPLKLQPKVRSLSPTAAATAPGSATAPENQEPVETPELRSGKAEAAKNAIIQAAGAWGFDYETEFKILGGSGRVDVMLELGDRRLACEISATTTAEQEVAHLLNCLSAGFTEIICVCDATVRRHRTESLLRQRIIPGQEACFHFLTLRQLQTPVADIGQAAQKLEGTAAGGKALAAAVTISSEEQEAIKQKLLGEIAERRAKARAAKVKPPES